MNIHIPFKRQALAGALALTLVAACLPAPQPTAGPNLSFAPTLPVAAPTPAANTAPTPAQALPPTAAAAPTAVAGPTATIAYTKLASDISKLPAPVEGWQVGDPGVAISITEYGDFQ